MNKRTITITIEGSPDPTIVLDAGKDCGDKSVDNLTRALKMALAETVMAIVEPMVNKIGIGKSREEATANAKPYTPIEPTVKPVASC